MRTPEKATEPHYVGWRGELLAELALARIPGLVVNKRPDRPDFDFPYDFLVATERGFCFFVEVKAFSSTRRGMTTVGDVGDWAWTLDANLVRQARESRSPILLFLFDADTDQGRFLRLDTLPTPSREVSRVTVHIPEENTIDKDSLGKLIADLQGVRET